MVFRKRDILENVDTEKLELDMLMKNGLMATLQGLDRINEQLNKYIIKIFKGYYKENATVANEKVYESRLIDYN